MHCCLGLNVIDIEWGLELWIVLCKMENKFVIYYLLAFSLGIIAGTVQCKRNYIVLYCTHEYV